MSCEIATKDSLKTVKSRSLDERVLNVFYDLMLSEMTDMLNDLIIVQCIHVLKHHTVPDKYT